jgi:cobalt-zinc-cadmium efflux system outer membrane protein
VTRYCTRAGAVVVSTMIGLSACVHFEPKPVAAPANLTALEARTLDDPEFGAFLVSNAQVAEWPPRAWDLKTLTLAGFYFHPDLDVARASWAVARAGVITAGARPNPDASLAPGYNSTTPTSLITPWILTLNLDFTIETAGKRGYRVSEATHLSDAARLNVAAVAWRVRSGVRQNLLDLYGAIQAEALLVREQTIQSSIVELLGRQLEAGAISPVEVTRARIELGAVRLALQDVARRRAEDRVLLAESVGVSVHALDGIELDFGAFAQEPPEVPSAEARRQALLNRPDILGALSEYAAGQAALQLEIAKQYPDVHLGPGYEMDQSDNKWTLGVGLTLPIFNRNQGPIAEALARRTEAAARFNAVQAAAIGQLDLALAAYRASLEKMATTRAILSDQQRQQRSTRAQYEAGELSRLELNSVDLQVAVSELAALDARLRTQEALGQVEDAMQTPAALADWVTSRPPKPPGGGDD